MHSPRRVGLRRPVAIAVWIIGLALVVAACSSNGDDASPDDTGDTADAGGDPTTITFSYLWAGPEAEALEEIIAAFNASQDEVIVEGVSSPDFQAQLTSMSASNGSFDVSDHFGNSVGSWADTGILEPLDGYLDEVGLDTSDFDPAAMDQMVYDGQIYSLPIATHTFQLLYNKTLLEEAGISEPPATMDQLAAAIAQLTEVDDNGDIVRLGIGNPDPFTTLTTLGYAFGGQWDGPDGPTPAEEGNVEALAWWQDNVIKPYGADKVAAFTAGWGPYMSPEDPFYTGDVAMVIDGEWRAVNIPDTAPDLDWGVVPIPAVTPELAGTTQLTASTMFIPANAQHKEAAAVFLEYLLDPEAMRDFSLALGNLPARVSLIDDPVYADIPNFDVWLDALGSANTHALASRPYSQEYAEDLRVAFDEVLRDTMAPAEALQGVADRAATYAND